MSPTPEGGEGQKKFLGMLYTILRATGHGPQAISRWTESVQPECSSENCFIYINTQEISSYWANLLLSNLVKNLFHRACGLRLGNGAYTLTVSDARDEHHFGVMCVLCSILVSGFRSQLDLRMVKIQPPRIGRLLSVFVLGVYYSISCLETPTTTNDHLRQSHPQATTFSLPLAMVGYAAISNST